MDIVFIVQRKPKINDVVQGRQEGKPMPPLPLTAHCFKVVDTRTGDYLGQFDTEVEAQARCDLLNKQLPQNQLR